MNTSSRFVVATHVLVTMAAFKLASGKYQAFKSDFIANSVNTNPVVIRRILGLLRKAGLVISQTGPEGGSKIAKDPEKVSLLQIHEAVEDCNCFFHLHYRDPNQECPIGYNIQDALGSVFADAESAIKDVLAKKMLSEIARDIMDRSGISKKLAEGFSVEQLMQDFVFKSGELIQKSLVV